MALTQILDDVMDRTVVLGYTKVGSSLRRRWWPADPQPGSLVGHRVLVTGGTSGIGLAMAGSFAELGATTHVLGRNPAKLRDAVAAMRRRLPQADLVEEQCDVGDLDSVRTWAEAFRDRVPALHGLVHNAGVMTPERQESAQGHEMALSVHVLGPHLMTSLLRGPLAAADGASVVWVSSGGMYGAKLYDDPDDLESRRAPYRGVQAYARTKRMQVVLADEWAERLAGPGVHVESMHPGWVDTPGVQTDLPTFHRLTRRFLRDGRDGADTAVWLVATRPPSRPEHFWHDRAQRPTTFGWQRADDPAVRAGFLAYVESATHA